MVLQFLFSVLVSQPHCSCGCVGWSVSPPVWSSIVWITTNLWSDIVGAQRMNPKDHCYPSTLHVLPPAGQSVILSLLPDGLVKHVVQTFMMPRWFVPVTLVILWLFLFSHHEVDIVKYQNYNVLEWNLVQTFLINCNIFGETLTLHGFKHLCALLGEFLFTDHTIIQITHESWFVTFHICNHN